MKNNFVSVLMGSKSDLNTMNSCFSTLEELKVPYEFKILSAHRTPSYLIDYIKKSDKKGIEVYIAAAGLAAHLAGSIAANTLNPVIGVPIDSGTLRGIDSLLSTVQMPSGIPVATVAIGIHGAVNSAYLAAQIYSKKNKKTLQLLINNRKKKEIEILNENKKF